MSKFKFPDNEENLNSVRQGIRSITLEDRDFTVFHVLRKGETTWTIAVGLEVVEIPFLSPGFGLQTNEIASMTNPAFIYFEELVELLDWLDGNQRLVSKTKEVLQ